MVAQITTLHMKAGMLDELIRHVQDATAPEHITQPGFGGMTLLIDPSTNRAVLIGYWDTEAELQATEQQTQNPLTELLSEPATSTRYEVSVLVELTDQGSAAIRGI